jgi:nucleotide-binding universal stress UspA family protein
MAIAKAEIKHILFATDHSQDARHAFAYAAKFAQQFDAKLTLLHVVQELSDLLIFDAGIERSGAAEKRLSLTKTYIQNAREKFLELAKAEYGGVDVDIDDIVVEKGNPVKMILKVAEEKGCDLIVMGKRGRGTLPDAMMGDTVAGVLRRSKVPVLVLRQSKQK